MPQQQAKLRVLLFGTHVRQHNGYSRTVYELGKALVKNHSDAIELGIFGFQGAVGTPPGYRSDFPASVFIHDAAAHEEPKQQGFGFEQIPGVVASWRPDVCVIYNDVIVMAQCLQQLIQARPEARKRFRIVYYADLVYEHMKPQFVGMINQHVDGVIAFTAYWQGVLEAQGVRKDLILGYLPHGIDPRRTFPVPQKLAREYMQIAAGANGAQGKEDFIVLNLNRNQPRKRWDICMKAWAEVVSRRPDAPIKLLVGTAVQGCWHLLELYERELKKRGLTLDQGLKHLILLDAPQQLSDDDVNVLYNCADVGINTCDGEGFGLCNFEQAALGIPQIVPRLGGFLEFMDDECGTMVEPVMAYYVDSTRDGAGGEALLCDYRDFADAVLRYYDDRSLLQTHGRAARERIMHGNGVSAEGTTTKKSQFMWADVARKFRKLILPAAPQAATATAKATTTPDNNNILLALDTIDEAVLSKDELASFLLAEKADGQKTGGGGVRVSKGQRKKKMNKKSTTAATVHDMAREVHELKQQILQLCSMKQQQP